MKKYIFLFGILILIISLSCMSKSDNKNITLEIDDKVSLPKDLDMSIEKENIKQDIISESVLSLLDNYEDFKRVLKNAHIDIPNENNFIPQGITIMQDYYIICGYYENGKNSKCYVIDQDNNIINVVELDTNSHVGSIYYDELFNLIWLPDNNGYLNIYNASEFLVNKEVKYLDQYTLLSEGLPDYTDKNKNLIAYLTIDDGYLYIGNFYKTKESYIKKFQIIATQDKLNLEYINTLTVPKKTQAIFFYEKDNTKYLVASNSFNRRTSSHIYVYEYKENITDYSNLIYKDIEIPPMSEGITIKDERIHIIFESTASKYPNAIDKVGKICELDLNEILK